MLVVLLQIKIYGGEVKSDPILCSFCQNDAESVEHVLFHCERVAVVWFEI